MNRSIRATHRRTTERNAVICIEFIAPDEGSDDPDDALDEAQQRAHVQP
jgi:hypothetical protein